MSETSMNIPAEPVTIIGTGTGDGGTPLSTGVVAQTPIFRICLVTKAPARWYRLVKVSARSNQVNW